MKNILQTVISFMETIPVITSIRRDRSEDLRSTVSKMIELYDLASKSRSITAQVELSKGLDKIFASCIEFGSHSLEPLIQIASAFPISTDLVERFVIEQFEIDSSVRNGATSCEEKISALSFLVDNVVEHGTFYNNVNPRRSQDFLIKLLHRVDNYDISIKLLRAMISVNDKKFNGAALALRALSDFVSATDNDNPQNIKYREWVIENESGICRDIISGEMISWVTTQSLYEIKKLGSKKICGCLSIRFEDISFDSLYRSRVEYGVVPDQKFVDYWASAEKDPIEFSSLIAYSMIYDDLIPNVVSSGKNTIVKAIGMALHECIDHEVKEDQAVDIIERLLSQADMQEDISQMDHPSYRKLLYKCPTYKAMLLEQELGM